MRTVRNHGFTLVELMIVIVILGILTAIGVFAFQSAQQKSRDSRRKNDLSQVAKALEMYINDVGSYPVTGTGADDGKITGCGDVAKTVCDWGTSFANTTKAVYMIKLPKDPSSTRTKYRYEKFGYGYRLYARLENLEDADIPQTGQKYYNQNCSTGADTIYCNYAITSLNVSAPDVVP